MSTIKISELPKYSTINANTANTLFVGVDVPTDTTYQFTAHTLAQGLYANEVLNVGINTNTLPNTVAQFALGGNSYIQTNLVNTNDGGSADMVVTANVGSGGTDSAYFMDMGLANKNYSPGNEFNNIGTSIYPLDGYLYMQGLNGTSPGGNLIVGTTTSNTELRLIVGGGTVSNIVAKFTSTGLVLNTQSYLTFADGTKQSTAGAPYAYSNAAFLYANTQVGLINSVNVTQNTSIAASFTQANAAFNYANTQVGLINGVDVAQNTYSQASFLQANTSNSYAYAANTWLQANDATTLTSAKSYTDTANTYIQTNYVANTSAITTAGSLTVTGALYASNTIRTPTVYSGPQTAITIPFNNSGMIKCNTAAGVVVTLSNFIPGKFVDLIVVNTSGSTQSVTHGVSAINSTVNSTSFNMPGTSTAYLRYFSITSDIANTFVSIQHA